MKRASIDRWPGVLRGVVAGGALAAVFAAASCAPKSQPSTARDADESEAAPSQATDDGNLESRPPFDPVPEWLATAPDASRDDSIDAVEPLPEEPTPYEEISPAPHDELGSIEPTIKPADAEAFIEVAEAERPTIDFPIEINDRVLAFIDLYTVRRPDQFRAGLVRSGQHLDRLRRIFREEGLPEDLVYFAHVESAYKTSAYSRARAKGIFQFIAATGRRYGLKIDYWVDERSDPEKSARASAAYLRDLHEEFGDWYLALAGYNAGEGKIRRALRRSGRKDFWGIARTSYIRRETKNYVPAILAAILISKQPENYGFSFVPDEPIDYETVSVDGAVDMRILAECAGVEPGVLKKLNPALRRNQTPPSMSWDLHVPAGTGDPLLTALAEIPESERVLHVRHRVRRGDTLSQISRRYGVTVYGVQQANGMGRSTLIREGRTLLIPTSSAARFPASAGAAYEPPADGDGVVRYRVRRGDNLWTIASRYGTSTHAIAKRSGISVRSTLRIGQTLTILPGDRSRGSAGSGSTTVTHRVRRGDTLWDIATRYGTTPRAIASASGISTRSTLRVGQRLTVPGGSSGNAAKFHTVRRGDTLSRIAARYRTSVTALCKLNSITRKTILYPGRRINLR